MKKPEPTMLPITRAMQAVSPRPRSLCATPCVPAGSVLMHFPRQSIVPATSGSFGQGGPREEPQRLLVGLAEGRLVDRRDLTRAVEPAQGAVDQETEVFV